MTTKLLPNEERSIALQMDKTLDLYLPEGIQEESDLRLYDQFFSLCRKIFFIFELKTREEIKQLFIQFYNNDYSGKLGTINILINEINSYVTLSELLDITDEEENDERKVDFYLIQSSRENKASVLYFFDRGYVAETESDLQEYFVIVDEIDNEILQNSITTGANEKDDLYNVGINKGVEVEPVELDQSPEAVVSRYLKGSGVYDPALRNSGFRVDKDMQI